MKHRRKPVKKTPRDIIGAENLTALKHAGFVVVRQSALLKLRANVRVSAQYFVAESASQRSGQNYSDATCSFGCPLTRTRAAQSAKTKTPATDRGLCGHVCAATLLRRKVRRYCAEHGTDLRAKAFEAIVQSSSVMVVRIVGPPKKPTAHQFT